MNNGRIAWNFKSGILLLFSIALLLAGGALLHRQVTRGLSDNNDGEQNNPPKFTVTRTAYQTNRLEGAFPADSVHRFSYQYEGKAVFDLLIADYRDSDNKPANVILFPESDEQNSSASKSNALNPATQRSMIWRAAAKAIREKAPKDALFFSWWDDGQRIRFLGNRDVWLSKPAEPTFNSRVWQDLQEHLILAVNQEADNLSQMAKWLTMDSSQAIAEMRAVFGGSRPLYLLVNNDLLMRSGELAGYGGKSISLKSSRFPAGSDLHGDIAMIKRWAYEEGDGNYLVQKEGAHYRAWVTSNITEAGKNTLLIRLLPFVESLKKLPDGVGLVYQSHWGAYLSIYKLDFASAK